MTTNMLKHGNKCGGPLVVDISNKFLFSSPSMGISPEGLTIGPVEITENPVSGNPVIMCKKCNEVVDLNDEKSVQGYCQICHKVRPASQLFTSFYPFLSCICTKCIAVLEGKEESENAVVTNTLSYFLIPPGTVKFISLVEIFKKPF